MTDSAPTLPKPMLINGLNHISPPSVAEFDSVFGGYLPPGKTIPSSWGVTRYYDFSPDAPASKRRVVLIHGGGTCAIGMAPLAFRLTEAGNHVVIYDLWGHGISSTPLEAHAPPLMHAQLLELLAHLGWPSAHLLGFSLGGAIGVTFAARHAAMVQSLVVLAGAGLWRKSERGWWDSLMYEGGWGLEFLSRRKIMAAVGGTDLREKPGWKERMLKNEIDTVPIENWERDTHKGHVASIVSTFRYCAYDQHEGYRELAAGDVPVLVIVGEKDSVIEPEHTKKELAKLGWKGDISIVAGATHEVARSHSKEVAELAGKLWGSLEK